MGVHDGHRERLRARFLKYGLASFEEHNALELILFYALPRCDTNEIAHNLIKKFGSFAGVLEAPIEELIKVPQIGTRSATLLKIILESGAFYMNSKSSPGEILNTTEKAGAFFIPKFFGKQTEQVYIAMLDDKRKVIRYSCISKEGIVNAVPISVKHIVTESVISNATGIILAHNHPGGVALPSANDKKVTKKVYYALKSVHIELVDHIIVTDEDFVSLADSGFFQGLEKELPY